MIDKAAVTAERRIRMAGPLNFRDLGGYPTCTGETVRWRRAFRSDSLGSMTEEDAGRLTGELGVRTVIDLRTRAEIDRTSPVTLRGGPWRYHHMPLIDETGNLDPVFFPGVALHDLYWWLLRRAGPRIAAVLEVLASSTEPAVFFCAAGKDRTGLVAALLLGMLGVNDGDIARDYALTAPAMPGILERARTWSAEAGGTPAFPPQVYGAAPETMRRLLAEVREEHGSALGYVLDSGLDISAVEELRGLLLE
jgi:protein-tyrosine phosphatase